MNTVGCRANLIVPVAVIMLLAISVKAEFRLIDLGTLGGDASSAFAINNRGEIIGWSKGSDGVQHGFYYRDGSLRILNTNPCEAIAINDAGQIVGNSLTPFTNILIEPPFPPIPPFTNPIVILPSNPIVILPTNPIVSRPTNIIMPPLANILTGFTDTTNEVAVMGSSQILGSDLARNFNTMTNVGYMLRPALFRHNSLVGLFQGTNSGIAAGINDRNEIVGSVSVNDGPTHAFLYRKGLTMDLGTLGGFLSAATGINNRGDVVGFSITSPQIEDALSVAPEHPFLYRHGLMRDLGTLGGTSGAATAINDLGEIVGWSTTTSNVETHAFLYRDGKMTDLGALGNIGEPIYGFGAPSYNAPLAINNWGQIVGSYTTTNGAHAFIYSNGTMTDLNDLAKLTYINGPEGFLVLMSARGINDWGQIVGEGLFWDGANPSTRAFLMDWHPEHWW